jgi:hypothetical protein
MKTRTLLIGVVAGAFLSFGGLSAHAQSSRLIQTMDVNGDGKVSRDELEDGSAKRRMFDGLVEKYKLDPKKTYTLKELEEAAGMSSSGSSGSTSGSPSSAYRPNDTRRGPPSRGSTGSRSSRPASDGRPYRALEELPDKYRSYDKDGDGQVGLYEWPKDRIAEFLGLDRNDDGFLTISELKKPTAPNGNPDKKPETEKTSPGSEKS